MRFWQQFLVALSLPVTLQACSESSFGGSSSELADAPRIEDPRLLHIEGTRNFRDLGGYKTADGRSVKKGLLYRADSLAHLENNGLGQVSKLNLKVITDLRSDTEREDEPDNIPQTSPAIRYDILPINDFSVDIREIGRKIVMGQIDEKEAMNLLDLNRFVTSSRHKKHWGDWIKSLAENQNTPQVFHCTSGKDRTGYGAVILLLTLGVSKEEVMKDFLFSNTVLDGYNEASVEKIKRFVSDEDSIATIRKIMGVNRETLENAFAAMEADFGSIDGFIENGLDIDMEMRAALQSKFLE